MPIERVDDGPWLHAPRLPLGATYRGTCHARPGEVIETQRDHCNCGYARGHCDRFPAESKIDAVRFSMNEDRLIYVFEAACAPVEHGVFNGGSEILVRQAEAFRGGNAPR